MCGSPPGMGFLQFLSYSYFSGGFYESDDHASKILTTWAVSSYTGARWVFSSKTEQQSDKKSKCKPYKQWSLQKRTDYSCVIFVPIGWRMLHKTLLAISNFCTLQKICVRARRYLKFRLLYSVYLSAFLADKAKIIPTTRNLLLKLFLGAFFSTISVLSFVNKTFTSFQIWIGLSFLILHRDLFRA